MTYSDKERITATEVKIEGIREDVARVEDKVDNVHTRLIERVEPRVAYLEWKVAGIVAAITILAKYLPNIADSIVVALK